jgi:hypothetical protein
LIYLVYVHLVKYILLSLEYCITSILPVYFLYDLFVCLFVCLFGFDFARVSCTYFLYILYTFTRIFRWMFIIYILVYTPYVFIFHLVYFHMEYTYMTVPFDLEGNLGTDSLIQPLYLY